MDRQQFPLSYGGDNDVGDYLYNFPAGNHYYYEMNISNENSI